MTVKVTYDFDQMLSSARDAAGEELLKMADEGLDFVLTYSDNIAPSTASGRILTKYPERCFNFGIAEANQVGASAGMALAGEKVFGQWFGPFLSLRATDQLHTDIAYNDVDVKLIVTHSGVTAGGGPTHNCIADLAIYRAIPNLTVVIPADAGQCIKTIRAAMTHVGPMVIRIARGAEPNVYMDNDYEFEIGKAIEVKGGDDLTIISAGSSVYWSMMGAKELAKKGINARVIDMHTIKPLDVDMIKKCAQETNCVVTVEEHSINGGLGGAVAEVLSETGFKGKFKRIGLPDQFAVLGDPMEVYKYYGMDPEGIAKTISELLGK
ncbi:MAG: transketolase [Eubacteriaceae bacterium]|nr:transketolase [Eubacteriaceae bacterium]